MPTIAILLPDLRGGGAEKVGIDLARAFVAAGYGVDVVLLQAQGELLARLPAGCRVIDLKVNRIRQSVRAISHYLRDQIPDAVLAAMWPLTVAAVMAKRMSGFQGRVVVSDHNSLSQQYADRGPLHKLILKSSLASAYRLADARVAVSAGVADDLSLLSGIPQDRFTTIYNPVAVSASDHGGLAHKWGEGHKLKVLTVGSLKPQKNQDLLIRAFAKVSARSDAALVILGEGSMRPALERLIADLDLASRVNMPGFVEDPGSWYRSADVFVLSSNYEGFGNVIVEALAAGLPIVSTDCPSGPSEILAGGRFGRLVPVGNAQALADAILAAAAVSPDRTALQARAADFAPAIAAQKYLDVLFPRPTRSGSL